MFKDLQMEQEMIAYETSLWKSTILIWKSDMPWTIESQSKQAF